MTDVKTTISGVPGARARLDIPFVTAERFHVSKLVAFDTDRSYDRKGWRPNRRREPINNSQRMV